MNRPVVEIDTEALWQAVRHRLYRLDKKPSEVARLLRFSPQIFTEIKASAAGRNLRGERTRPYSPGGEIFLSICWWLDRDPRDFQRVRPEVQSEIEFDAAYGGHERAAQDDRARVLDAEFAAGWEPS